MTSARYEYKFTASQSAIAEISLMCHQTENKKLNQLISKKLISDGYSMEQSTIIEYKEFYYDTGDLYLLDNKASLKVRCHPEKSKITFKKIINPEDMGVFSISSSKKLQQEQIESLNSYGESDIATRLIQDTRILPDIGNRKFKLILGANILRIKYIIKKQEQRFTISIDIYRFENMNNMQFSDEFLEIELKAINDIGNDHIKEFISCFFSRFHLALRGLKPSSETKYSQGLQFMSDLNKVDFLNRLFANNRNLAFIVMKFGDENLDSAYEVAIKPAFIEAGYNPLRIDEIQDAGRITDQVLHAIKVASVIFADLTGERPNCYYECGYAHANGMKLILSIKKGENIHFDLKDHRFIVWRNEAELKRSLTLRLEALNTPEIRLGS